MAGSYPSVGLKIDLNEIVRAKAEISGLASTYKELGAAATAAAQASGAGLSPSGAGAAKSAMADVAAASKASAASQIADQEAIAGAQGASFRLTQQRLADIVAAEKAAASERSAIARAVASAIVGDDEAAAALRVSVQKAVGAELAAVDRYTADQRLATARAVEAERAAIASAEADQVLAAAKQEGADRAAVAKYSADQVIAAAKAEGAERAAIARYAADQVLAAAKEEETSRAAIAKYEADQVIAAARAEDIERTAAIRRTVLAYDAATAQMAVLENRINRAVATGAGGGAAGFAFDAQKISNDFGALGAEFAAFPSKVAPSIQALEKMNESFGHVAGGSRGALYELQVISHELTAGRFRQALSSSTILLQKLAVPLGLAVGFAIAATAALSMVRNLDASVTAYEKLHNASVTLGLDVATLQNLNIASEQLGIKTDSVTAGIGRMDQAFARARGGAKQQVDAFGALNISLSQNYTQSQLLQKVLEGWGNLGADGPRKVTVATELMGRSGRDLIPVLDELSKHYAAIDAEANLYGVHNQQAVINGAQLAAAFKEAGVAMQGLSATMLGLAGNGLAQMLEGFNRLIAQTVAWLNTKSTIDAYKSAMNGLGTAFGVVATVLGTLASNWQIVVAAIIATQMPVALGFIRAQMLGIAAAAAVATEGMTAFGIAQAAATGAGSLFLGGLKGIVTFLGGPVGIALIATAAAFKFLGDAAATAENGAEAFVSNQQSVISALRQTADFNSQYKISNNDVSKSLGLVIGNAAAAESSIKNHGKAMSDATKSALLFAEAQRLIGIQSLEAAAATAEAAARSEDSAAGLLRVGDAINKMGHDLFGLERGNLGQLADAAQQSGSQNWGLAAAARAAAAAQINTKITLPPPGDTSGDPTKIAKAKGAGQADSAQAGVDKLTDSIKLLNAQLDTAASFNLNPLADDQAKIAKAYDDALSKYSETTNAYKRGEAQTYANLAADKERLTLSVALADGFLKEARASQLKNDQLAVDTAGLLAGHAAIDAYYKSGVSGSAAYATAVAAQAAATLKAENAASDLALAQKAGTTSLNDISASLQRNLGLSKVRADQIQAEAIATANLQHETHALTQAQKDQTAAANEHSAAVKTVDDLNKQTAAYKAGATELALYDLQKLKDAAIAKLGSGAADPAQVAKAVADVQTQANADALNAAAKLDFAMQEQLRLATLSTAERVVDAQVQTTITEQTKATGAALSQQTKDLILQDALRKQAIIDAAKLEQTTSDAIRQAFIDSGKLDFSSLGKALEQTFRKSVYDALLAKPIDIIVKATVDLETKFLDQILGGGGGSSGGGFGGLLGGFGGLFGGGGAGGSGGGFNPFAPGTGAGDAISGFSGALGGLSKSLSGVSSVLGPVGAAFAVAQIGSQLAQSITGDHGPGAQIGGSIFGFIGGLIGSLFDNKPTNAAAGANFDSHGNPTFVQDGNKATPQTIGWAQQIASATTTAISNLSQFGIDAHNVLAGFGIGVRDPTLIRLNNGVQINTPVGDPQAASDAINKALLQYGTYTNAQEQKMVDQMLAANRSLADISTALQGFVQAQSDVQNIQLALLQYTNPAQYAVQSLQVQQLATRTTLTKDIAAGYFTPDQIATIAATLPQLEAAQISAALAGVASAAGGAAHSMQDFVTAQKAVIAFVNTLKTGSLSPLGPQAQLALDQNLYTTQLASATGGNYDAIQAITTTAQNYLTQAQKVFGSGSAYGTIFSQVTGDLTALGAAPYVDPQVQAIKDAQAALTAAINAQGLNIVAAIQGTTPGAANDNSRGGFTQAQIQQLLSALGYNAAQISTALAQGLGALSGTANFSVLIAAAKAGGLAGLLAA